MPKRSSIRPHEKDANVTAFRVVQEATQDENEETPQAAAPQPEPQPASGKNPAAVALGRLGGKKGGAARTAKLTPEKRREIAQKAARTRWSKQDG
jgi:hypothetical protein